jgi:hypothetical protein
VPVTHACNPSNSGGREAKIRKIVVQSQPRQIVHETLSRKYPSQKKGCGVAQGVGFEFKPQYWEKNKQTNKQEISRLMEL